MGAKYTLLQQSIIMPLQSKSFPSVLYFYLVLVLLVIDLMLDYQHFQS